MPVPENVRVLKTHEWARRDGDLVVVGITEYAVEQLNKEIVFVELPEPGRTVTQGQPFGVIEAVKAAEDLNSPMSGEVVEVNGDLAANPSLVAEGPFSSGWMMKIRPSAPAEWDSLLSPSDYAKEIESGPAH